MDGMGPSVHRLPQIHCLGTKGGDLESADWVKTDIACHEAFTRTTRSPIRRSQQGSEQFPAGSYPIADRPPQSACSIRVPLTEVTLRNSEGPRSRYGSLYVRHGLSGSSVSFLSLSMCVCQTHLITKSCRLRSGCPWWAHCLATFPLRKSHQCR